jgi:hypothetical protein
MAATLRNRPTLVRASNAGSCGRLVMTRRIPRPFGHKLDAVRRRLGPFGVWVAARVGIMSRGGTPQTWYERGPVPGEGRVSISPRRLQDLVG